MKQELSLKQTEVVLQALDKALHDGPWESSNFLRVIGKNLRGIREDFTQAIQQKENKSDTILSNLANRIALRSGQREIYVSLYSADGSNLQSWERILFNLPGQIISRPIYTDENQVKSMIRAKINKENEAYVSVYIDQQDILTMQPNKLLLDKQGHNLLSLKNKAIKLDNISRFVHLSKTYHYINGRLVPET